MKSPIQDLIDMVKQFKEADIEKLLETAYSRGILEGYDKVKEDIIEEIKKI